MTHESLVLNAHDSVEGSSKGFSASALSVTFWNRYSGGAGGASRSLQCVEPRAWPHPLGARSTPRCDNQNCVLTWPRVPRGSTAVAGEEGVGQGRRCCSVTALLAGVQSQPGALNEVLQQLPT